LVIRETTGFNLLPNTFCPTSLDLDVEMYADYFLKKGEAFLKMNQKSFNECLPYVLCGIVKNKIQYYYAKHPSCDIRRIIKYIQQQNKKLVPNVKTKHS